MKTHKQWKTGDGDRFSSLEMRRAQQRFRHHVRTPHNPAGRIRREHCRRHPHLVGQAHHVDYEQPFLVAWLCGTCHRKVEHGTLKLGRLDLWDYSSLVVQRPGGQK